MAQRVYPGIAGEKAIAVKNRRQKGGEYPPEAWMPGGSAFHPLTPNSAYPANQPGLPLSDSYGDDRYPYEGVAQRYYRVNNRVDLTQVDGSHTAPPTIFIPINDPSVNTTGGDGFTIVVQREIPGGFNGRTIRLRASATSSAQWSEAVEFALFIGVQMQGEPWLGEIDFPTHQPLEKLGRPKEIVSVKARITPQFFHTAVGSILRSAETPITSLVLATAWFELFCTAQQTPTEG